MSEKSLTEAAWKDLAKTRAKDLAALFKGFDALSKAEKRGAEAELEALTDIEKEAASLRKANKADKDIVSRLDDLDKALGKQRKAAQEAQAEQKRLAAKQAEQQEEEDTPDLLTTKTATALKEVRKGSLVAHVLIAVAGKETKVMVSKKAISPARGKVLKEQMENPSGLKFIRGECLFEEEKITFVVQTQAAGLAKRLNAALLAQLDKRMKVRVRGEDPADIDEDPDAVDDDEAGGEQPRGKSQEETASTDPLKDRFETRLEKIEPLVLAALRAQQGDTSKIRAVAAFAREKGEGGAYAAGLQALDTLEKLLLAGAGAVTPAPGSGSTEPKAQSGNAVDANAAFTARLTALMPKVKEALAAAGDSAQDVKLKVSEAGMWARKRDFDRAHQELDRVEELLEAAAKPDTEAEQWAQQLAAVDSKFLRVLKGNPANASALRAVMAYAAEQGEAKQFAKGMAALTRLDGMLEAVLSSTSAGTNKPDESMGKDATDEGAGNAGTDREKGYKGLFAYRKSLVEFNLAAQSVRSQIASLKSAIPSQLPDESELADELSDELTALTSELMDAVDSAMKTAENEASPITAALAGTLKAYADEVASSELITHVDRNPFGVAVSVRKTLGGALAAVRAALPAPVA